MERLQTASLTLADRTSAQVLQLWKQRASDRQFVDLASTLIARANAQGVSLVDLGLTAEVIRQLRQVTPPLGLTPEPQQIDRTRIASVLRETEPTRLGFVARSEVLLTVATTVQYGMAARGATGWRRQVDNKPCPICIRLDDGVIRSIATTMRRHPNCGCIQEPVFRQAGDPGPTNATPERRIEIWQDVAAETADFTERFALLGARLAAA